MLTQEHRRRIGPALLLLSWMAENQRSPAGLVLGGIVTYERIREATGFPVRTAQRCMKRLREGGYIEVRRMAQGLEIRVREVERVSETHSPQARRSPSLEKTKLGKTS